MGFSVSGASVVLFIALLMSVSLLYTSVSNGTEAVTEAAADASDRTLERRNTEVNVTRVSYDASNETLVVVARNTGTTALSVSGTDVLVDNRFEPGVVSKTAGDDPGSDLWVPGERLRVELSVSAAPDRVTVVTGRGVADAEVVP